MSLVRRALIVALGAGLSGPAGAQAAGEGPPRVSSARVAAQVGFGTLASPIAFFGTGVLVEQMALAVGASEGTADRAAYIGAYVGVWLTAAAVPAWIGRGGEYPVALLGSAAGLGAAVLSVKLGNLLYEEDRRSCGPACWSLGLLAVGLPSIGATIAYNASRE
jgi:hypothetical protein